MSKVADILTGRSGDIWSVQSDQSVLAAIKLMAEKGVGALLVIDDNRLSGILSERDYARKVILENRSSSDTRVKDIMTRNPVTTARESSVAECMSMMTDNDFRHLPVVEGERVIGMISIGDLVKAVIKEQQFTISQLQQYIAG
ncbi:CBS domain-containing protein [Candidatus Spongiihabitans sp.]|uniref:CBS domain-containing protein n=1 Tax=Candidatus Spongiihabitans sp. TaxID=3101308 RepID=UPI003C7BE4DE